jgi:hypothetical protein
VRLAGQWERLRLESSSGGAFVGNFGFDLDHEMTTRGRRQVYADHPTAQLAYVAADGEASVAASEMHFPNGSVITPDGKTLIVGETLGGGLTAFDLGAGASIWIASPGTPECVRIAPAERSTLDNRATPACWAATMGAPVHADGSARERYRPGRPAGGKAVGRRSRGPTRRPSMIVTAREGRRSRLHLNETPTIPFDRLARCGPFRG